MILHDNRHGFLSSPTPYVLRASLIDNYETGEVKLGQKGCDNAWITVTASESYSKREQDTRILINLRFTFSRALSNPIKSWPDGNIFDSSREMSNGVVY
ncbi:hypothetical protein L1887_34722 [Cichorium endivia]|nr:hypothetical protein L1887_34722 [Cichorium endivia]